MAKKTTAKKSTAKAKKADKRTTGEKMSQSKKSDKATKSGRKSTVSASVNKSAKKGKKKTLTEREEAIQRIKQKLLAQRESLLKEAEETLNILPGEINFPDMGDQASAETDRNFILRLRDRERMLLKKIEETIERIEHNEYGICEECSNEIGTKRLEARPVTTLCIECKTRQEEEERIAEGG